MVADLWERLGTGLTRLERVSEAPPDVIVAEAREELPPLQYSLHATAELAHGIDPPPAAAAAHRELVEALAQARDATADVAEAAEDDDEELVEQLVPEWRGALFRVRLARLRALESTPARGAEAEHPAAPELPPGIAPRARRHVPRPGRRARSSPPARSWPRGRSGPPG